MSAAMIASDGKVRILDGKSGADEVVTEDDAKDPARVARMLARILATLAALKRTFSPPRLDFEDVVVSTAGATVQLQHNLKGRVRWWVIGWQSAGTAAPVLIESATATTATTLVLASYVAGTASIRLEATG